MHFCCSFFRFYIRSFRCLAYLKKQSEKTKQGRWIDKLSLKLPRGKALQHYQTSYFSIKKHPVSAQMTKEGNLGRRKPTTMALETRQTSGRKRRWKEVQQETRSQVLTQNIDIRFRFSRSLGSLHPIEPNICLFSNGNKGPFANWMMGPSPETAPCPRFLILCHSVLSNWTPRFGTKYLNTQVRPFGVIAAVSQAFAEDNRSSPSNP